MIEPSPKMDPPPAPGSWRFFRLAGVPVRLHFTFVLLAVFLLVTGLGGDRTPGTYVLYVLGLFASLLLHELAHALASRRFGIRTLEVVMFPIGGVARLSRSPKPAEEWWIALAGPLMNGVLAAVLYAIALGGRQVETQGWERSTEQNLATQLFFGNLALALFNLLPAFPMDGGRVLRAILAGFKPEDQATRIAAWAGRMLAISLALYALLSAKYLLVFAAFFIYLGAAQEAAAALGRTLTAGIPVRAAMMTGFHTLPHGSMVREAVGLSLDTSQQDFPVVHGGQVSGLLSRHAILKALAAEGPEAYVAGAMERDFLTLTPDMDLADALPVMARAGSCALVMEGDTLLGLLTSENLSQFLMLRRFGMEPVDMNRPSA
jgi:Zn-dependent protease/CBS domain-containing protein